MTELGGDDTLAGDERATAPPDGTPMPVPERGDTIGRFVVLDRKGGGSMGVVYAAYDPELDRKVALKVLHPRRSIGPGAADERSRLLREAQAIARVSHPHVIAIHDVGETGGGVFLAMEYIDGPTLAQWLAARPRTTGEIIEVFAAAGRGLAAAHAKNLVHRDFKPDNVMLDDDDGRVRVLDFGLVRTTGDDTPVSEDGIVGTPAYMAPEQLAGRGIDARSDQFGFCVALYEALYGARPFVGRDLASLGAAITAGVVPAAPAGTSVPSWLRRVVVRGLAVDKDARWPDMNALVEAIAADRTRGRARTIAIAAVGFGAAATALGVVLLGDTPHDDCARLATEADVWGPARREALETRVVGDGSPFRSDTWSRVAALLDARGESLHAATTAACLAAPNDALAGARQLCVARHRRQLDATITALLDADLGGLVGAIPAVEAIPDAIACDDAATLGDELAPPAAAIAELVQAARDDLARAHADALLGHQDDGIALAEAALARARELGYRPLVAEAGLVVAAVQARAFRYADAEATLRAGFEVAIEVGDDRLAVAIAAALTRVVGEGGARPGEGLVWGEIGRALLRRGQWVTEATSLGHAIAGAHERAGDPRAALAELRRVEEMVSAAGREPDGEVQRALSNLHRSLGDADAARDAAEVALELDTVRFGPDHPVVADDLALVGAAAFERGDHALAIDHYESALATLERAFGPDDPRLAATLSNIGTAFGTSGDYAAALPPYERALAISIQALGSEHPDTLETASNIATLYLLRGDTAESVRRQLELLPRFERQLGRDHPSVAGLLANLGSAESLLGRHDDALAHLQRAVEIGERTMGDHVDLASSLFVLADAYSGSGNPAKAMPLFERSLAIYERRRGPDHVDASWPLLGIGAAAMRLGEDERAIAVLQRAVALRDAAEISPAERGEARFQLARALWARVDARTEALALATAARLEQVGDPKAVAEIDAWLRDHED